MIFRVYTREVDPEAYPEGLARAVHLSCRRPGGEEMPLNRNYGILFPRGEISAEDTIIPMGIRNPEIFRMEDGRTGICGERVHEDGTTAEGEENWLYLWTSRDLISFDEIGPVDAASLAGYERGSTLEVDGEIAEAAVRFWSPVVFGSVSVPEEVKAESADDLARVTAEVRYSDGSAAAKQVRWDTSLIDFSQKGVYEVTGEVMRQAFAFPLAKGYGDPVIFKWEGRWYFLGTNDNLNDIGIYVREAENPEGLFAGDVTEHLILPFDPERGLEQTFWAPEFHVIGGEPYILFAVSGHQWGPQCHLLKLKRGGRIIRAEDWEDPRPVVRKDGSPLCGRYDSPVPAAEGTGVPRSAGTLPDSGERPITLDMTYIRAESGSYAVWSYRKHIGTPMDSGSMLYIARIDEERPWVLAGDPVLLSRPLYGWENVSGTINNEGPNAFIRGGKVFLTYSGGSANAYTYALGLLTADAAADLSDPAVWEKSIAPVLTFYSVAGEYGPGHNAFFTNDAGELMISYHAETGLKEHLRCDAIRRVHFRSDGTPYFQMSAEEDLPGSMRQVKTTVITGARGRFSGKYSDN